MKTLWLAIGCFLALAALADDEAKYYRVTRIEEPKDEQLEVGGLDFAADGKLYVCTRRGNLWVITNPTSDDPKKISWKLFATGLHEPLGLTVDKKTGDVLVVERPQGTRIRDTDHDGVADSFETVCEWETEGTQHEYPFGFGRDKQGNLYLTLSGILGAHKLWHGWVMKLAPDGKLSPVAVGLRSPDGIGNDLDGNIFYTDNQGNYEETCGMWHIVEGAFFGHPAGLRWRKAVWPNGEFLNGVPEGEPMEIPTKALAPFRTLPAVWFPYGRMGQSLGQPVADSTRGKFGPFAGQLFVSDQKNASVMRATVEKIGGKFQGACYPFRSGFDCGVHRGAFAPDGSLFVGETERGWGSVGPKSWGLQRIKWNGETPFEIHHVSLKPDGFDLTFTKRVDTATASDPKTYNIIHWWMQYRTNYGSPEQGQTHVPIESVAVSPDKRTVSLKLLELVKQRVYEIHVGNLTAADGTPLAHRDAYYTLNQTP